MVVGIAVGVGLGVGPVSRHGHSEGVVVHPLENFGLITVLSGFGFSADVPVAIGIAEEHSQVAQMIG